jgi:hypothetical protein
MYVYLLYLHKEAMFASDSAMLTGELAAARLPGSIRRRTCGDHQQATLSTAYQKIVASQKVETVLADDML